MTGVKRIPSGIHGLDQKIDGGFELGSVISVLGGPGSGKSLLGMSFLYEGLKNGETCLLVSFEENVDDLISDMENIGLKDVKDFISNKKLIISFNSPINFEYLWVLDVINQNKISRVVIDSLSAISMYMEDRSKFRKFMLDLVTELKKLKVTAIVTDEQPQVSENDTLYFSGEYLSDAVIKLFYTGLGGDFDRSMQIIKMRRTNNDRSMLPMRIDQGGIYVK
jgi:RecA-superfamily ATPases implicated in signal transduction